MTINSSATLDFGYPWWLSYGHLLILFFAAAALLLGSRRKWPRWAMLGAGAVVLWSGAAFLVARFGIGLGSRASLPTEGFLRAGAGRILDIGAGTGRSSIMALESRPRATVVALDLFGESFERHFGKGASPRERLLANLRAAGVESRAEIRTADMRQLPFERGEFDAIVSAYAIDHLDREGIHKTLAEAARVVKPGGDFLLMVIAKEPWVQFAFGPLLTHRGPRGADWWTARLRDAGFEVREEGTRPGTLYLLARRL